MQSVPMQTQVDLEHLPEGKVPVRQVIRMYRETLAIICKVMAKRRQMRRAARRDGKRVRVTFAQAYLAYIGDMLKGAWHQDDEMAHTVGTLPIRESEGSLKC